MAGDSKLDRLAAEARAIVGAAVAGVVEGSSEDLALLTGELADDVIEAASAGDEAALDLTVARIRLAAERMRIRANDAAWDILADVSRALFRILREIVL